MNGLNPFISKNMLLMGLVIMADSGLNVLLMGRGGVQAFQIGKQDFDLLVGGDGLDMYQQL